MHGEHSDWVKRYVYAQYGDDPSGLAVFKESFNPSFHIVDNTQLIPGYPSLSGRISVVILGHSFAKQITGAG